MFINSGSCHDDFHNDYHDDMQCLSCNCNFSHCVLGNF